MPITIIRAEPLFKSGQFLLLKPEYRDGRMSKVLQIESFCTPTSLWCLEGWGMQEQRGERVWGHNALAGAQHRGTGHLRKHYDLVTEDEAMRVMGAMVLVRVKRPVESVTKRYSSFEPAFSHDFSAGA